MADVAKTTDLGHTPGPWEIRSRHESRMDHTTVVRSVAIPGHDYIEVSRLTDPTPEQDQVARANVRLIAAAPELLALLKELIDIEGPQPGHIEWARKVQAAIAKAEGRS